MHQLDYFMLAVIIITRLADVWCGDDVDYCDSKMCPYQGKHVACGKTKKFSDKCQGEPKLEDMEPYIQLIEDETNYYRNRLASGKVKCFYPAARMPSVQWDPALAETAEYNVKSCVFAHDECRSTKKFRMAGQNIYTAKTKNLDIPVKGFIKEAILLWFDEQVDANLTVLKSYHKTSPQTGHFTLLVSDRQTYIGCAFLNNLLPGPPVKRMVIFTCNYSSSNFRNIPSYKPGPPASQCKKRHRIFESLCAERIDPDDLSWYKY
ncbi:antigen 5 like allergen Cul n 1-like [Stomoxys calcitrans]|uniref:SCP domain-containing protein n=1 Tax=Stomoxys calcitrans TaxID=35570 RepID=A0A1I8Q289_STOCA|nr:antigen 5 like allergen Cul n 1-like [Stomoxys calcitrans]